MSEAIAPAAPFGTTPAPHGQIKMEVPVSKSFTYIEYGMAREIIGRLGLRARREGDYLKVIKPKPEATGFSLYMKPEADEELVATMFIDEGLFEDTMAHIGSYDDYFRTPILGIMMNRRRNQEFIAADAILSLMARAIKPDAKIKSSPYLGSKISSRHYVEQYVPLLLKAEHKELKFV